MVTPFDVVSVLENGERLTRLGLDFAAQAPAKCGHPTLVVLIVEVGVAQKPERPAPARFLLVALLGPRRTPQALFRHSATYRRASLDTEDTRFRFWTLCLTIK